MAVSRTLRRLLRLRGLEEEGQRLDLETALLEVTRVEAAIAVAVGHERWARQLVESGIRSGEMPDRFASQMERQAAMARLSALEPLRAAAEEKVARVRAAYLAKRVERRQAETLIREIESRDAVETGRRTQHDLDDWHSARQRALAPPAGSEPKPGQQPGFAGKSGRNRVKGGPERRG